MLVLLLLLITLEACSNQIEENEEGIRYDSSLDALTYHVEEQAWSAELADVFSEEDMEEVKEAYEIAIHDGDLLQNMPCYCGCGEVGHEHNQHCFVTEIDDQVAYIDQMGFG